VPFVLRYPSIPARLNAGEHQGRHQCERAGGQSPPYRGMNKGEGRRGKSVVHPEVSKPVLSLSKGVNEEGPKRAFALMYRSMS